MITFNKDATKVLRADELRELARYIVQEGGKGNYNIHISAKPRGDNDLQIIADYLKEGNKPPFNAVRSLLADAVEASD